jgi:hypothetical protein
MWRPRERAVPPVRPCSNAMPTPFAGAHPNALTCCVRVLTQFLPPPQGGFGEEPQSRLAAPRFLPMPLSSASRLNPFLVRALHRATLLRTARGLRRGDRRKPPCRHLLVPGLPLRRGRRAVLGQGDHGDGTSERSLHAAPLSRGSSAGRGFLCHVPRSKRGRRLCQAGPSMGGSVPRSPVRRRRGRGSRSPTASSSPTAAPARKSR